MSTPSELLIKAAEHICDDEYAGYSTTQHVILTGMKYKFTPAYDKAMEAFDMLRPQTGDEICSQVFWWDNTPQGDEQRVLGICFAAAMAEDM